MAASAIHGGCACTSERVSKYTSLQGWRRTLPCSTVMTSLSHYGSSNALVPLARGSSYASSTNLCSLPITFDRTERLCSSCTPCVSATMEDFFLKIEFSSPMDEDVRNYPNLPLYVVTKCICAFPHNARPDSGLYGRTCLEMVTQFKSEELLRLAWTAREPEAWCELGYRYGLRQSMSLSDTDITYRSLTGCNGPAPFPDLYGALHMFDALIDRDLARERFVGDRASRELRARAHSGAADAYLRIWQTPVSDRATLETWRIGHKRPWPDYETI